MKSFCGAFFKKRPPAPAGAPPRQIKHSPFDRRRHILTLEGLRERSADALGKEVANMKQCTAAIGSLTYAIKAKRALEQAGLVGNIVKLNASMTRRGCAYGLEFHCEDQRAVRAVMNAQSIPVTDYINGGGGTIL